VTTDALDPGPDGDFPHWPRDGAATRMPSGIVWHRTLGGALVRLDVTPTDEHGVPIVPPT
jgi:hypothetical protein